MVALAKAVLFGPKVLLIDEMSHGLAPLVSERLLTMVRQLAQRHGTAVLLVEQTVDMALAVSDRAYVMRHGRIVMEGAGRRGRRRTATSSRPTTSAPHLASDRPSPSGCTLSLPLTVVQA